MGDVVHTVPVLVKLRRRYPQARIEWLITPENAELVRAHPALDGVVLFDRRAFRRERWGAWQGLWRLLRALRGARYDLVLDLHGQLRTGLFTLMTGAPVRLGFDRPRRRLPDGQLAPRRGWAGAREGAWLAYTHRLPIPTLQVHALDRYLWLQEPLGLDTAPPETQLYLAPEAEAAADQLLAGLPAERPRAVLAPGTLWETKHWRPEGFAEVAAHLQAAGWQPIITGTAADRARAALIRAAAPAALDLCGQTTPAVLAAVLARAQVAVTNDSGAMHLAVAMGVPVVPVFGPTNPVTVGPYGQAGHVVRAELPCSPCNLRRLAECPHGHACMQQVTSAQVWARLQTVAGEKRGARPANGDPPAILSANPPP